MRMQAVELAVTVLPVRASRDGMTFSDPDQLRDSHGSVFFLVPRVHCTGSRKETDLGFWWLLTI